MLPDTRLQELLKRFVRAEWRYDGLGGRVIPWTRQNGGKSTDPSAQVFVISPDGSQVERADDRVAYDPRALAGWLETKAAASYPLVDPKEFKVLRKLAIQVASRRKLGSALATLRVKAAEGTGEEQAEAKRLLETLLPFAEHGFKQAQEQQKDDPLAAWAAWKKLASRYKGDELGEQATKTVATLKKDKAFQREVKAMKMFRRVEALQKLFKRVKGQLDPTHEGFRRLNGKVLKRAASGLARIQKTYEGTVAAKKAAELMLRWGLEPKK